MLSAVGYPFIYQVAVLIEYREFSIEHFGLTGNISLFQSYIRSADLLSVAYCEQLIVVIVEAVAFVGIRIDISLNASYIFDGAAVGSAVCISLNSKCNLRGYNIISNTLIVEFIACFLEDIVTGCKSEFVCFTV